MPDNEDGHPVLPAAQEVVPAEPVDDTALAVPDMLAVDKSAPAAMVEPEKLVRGVLQLQERIPDFEQLSIEERRTMARAAYLDPAFIQAAVQVAGIWDRASHILGRSPEAMRQDDADARRWDDAIRSFSAILQGMQSANLKRKYRVGSDALSIYRVLGLMVRNGGPDAARLLPYYEEMKRLYRKNLPKKEKKGQKAE